MIMAEGAVFGTYANGVMDRFLKEGHPLLISKEEYESWVKQALRPEKYAEAFLEKLNQVLASGENLDLAVAPWDISKKGNGSTACGARVIPQKQDGLYTVVWHPLGGQPDPVAFCSLSDLLADMEDAEMRLAPDETAYIVNLTGDEAKLVLAATGDGAET